MNHLQPQALPATLTPREVMLIQLDRSVQAATRSSYQVNGLQAAITLHQQSHEQIHALYSAAPTLYQVLREQLRQALAYDPDLVEWTDRQQPSITLTQAAANYLHDAAIPADITPRITLKLASELGGADFPQTARQVLTQLQALGVQDRYNVSVRDYWSGIAAGQSVSCADYAGQLRRTLIRTQVTLAQACGQLSDEGAQMWLQVIDAPSQQERQNAGAGPAEREVSEIAWGNGNGSSVIFKGAFVVHARDRAQEPRELLFVPGLGSELFEYASRAELLAQLQTWTGSDSQTGWLLWQLLPYHSRSVLYDAGTKRRLDTLTYTAVTGDIFQHSANASFSTQHSNELLSAVLVSPALQTGFAILLPEDLSGVALSYAQTLEQWRREIASKALSADLVEAVAQLIRRDARWHADDITFGSLAVEVALRIRQEKIALHEHTLLRLLDASKLAQDSPPFTQFLEYQALLQAQRDASVVHLKDLSADRELENPDVLTLERTGGSHQRGLIASRSQALSLEGQLQHWQQQLSEEEFKVLKQALKLNISGADSTSSLRTVGVSMGTAEQRYNLVGVVVITSQQALLAPASHATTLLFVPGIDGGLAAFDSLQDVQAHIGKTLARYPGSALWLTVPLEEQVSARAWVNGLALPSSFVLEWHDIPIVFVEYSVKSQIKAHRKTLLAMKKRTFTVPDASRATSLRLLAMTTTMLLRVPEHAARAVALANIAIQRQAQGLKEKTLSVLGQASVTVQQDYARQLRVINESTLAVERYLSTNLPSASDFAAKKLRDQFKHDGFADGLDPVQGIFQIPDEVKVLKTFSPPHAVVPEFEVAQIPLDFRTYSLVELALENIDPEDAQTALRLKHMRVISPLWKARLSVEYLSRTLPALDVSGAYEVAIKRAFYGSGSTSPSFTTTQPENTVLTQLMSRPYRQVLELQLWLSRQQGMDEAALTLFSRAIRARKAADLKGDGLEVEVGQAMFNRVVEHFAGSKVGQVRVIHDKRSDLTLLYLPGFPEGKSLQRYPSLTSANAALAAMANDAQHMTYLVERVAPGEDEAKVQQYLADGAAYGPTDWLGCAFTADADMAWGLSLARPERLIRLLRLTSRSSAILAAMRDERGWLLGQNRIMSGISLVPGLNLISDIYFITQAVFAWRHTDDFFERMQLGLQIALCVTDIVMSVGGAFVPGSESAGVEVAEAVEAGEVAEESALEAHALTKINLQHLKVRQALSESGWEARATSIRARTPIDIVFKDYEIDRTPQDACALSGQYDRGSYLKDGVQFVVLKGKSYRVGRPKNAQALHLRHPLTDRWGPPIRLGENAEWHFATGYGLPGGVKPAVEYLLESGMSLEVAQGILADYDFPLNSGLEQLFAITVKQNGIRPDWANKFRAVSEGPIAGPSQPRPESVSLIKDLEDYALVPSVSPSRSTPVGSTMDSVVIGDREVLVDRTSNGDGFYPLYEVNPTLGGMLQRCGRLSHEGIYHLDEANEGDFVSISGTFYQAYFNPILNRLTVIRPGGKVQDGLVVEPQGAFRRMGEWQLAPVPAANLKVRLDSLSRLLLPQPVTEAQRLRHISLYGYQINKRIVPELHLARTVAEQDALAMEYSYRNGLPVESLISIFEAMIRREGVPEGLPVSDEIQGLSPVQGTDRNHLNVNAAFKTGNYSILAPKSAAEKAQHDALLEVLSGMNKLQLARMKDMNLYLRELLKARGYEALCPVSSPQFTRNHFRQVYRGPNGEVYLMAVKLLTPREASNTLRGIVMHTTVQGLYMSDAWVAATLASELRIFPQSPLLLILRDALERGRLYKVIIGVSKDADILLFRI